MARYLSEEWFSSVRSEPAASPTGPAPLILEQVVRATPDGDVIYRVEVSGGQARIVWPVPAGGAPADLRISSDWDTAVAVARGELSTQRALMEGRLRVSGHPAHVAELTDGLSAVDPVPVEVRQATTFEAG